MTMSGILFDIAFVIAVLSLHTLSSVENVAISSKFEQPKYCAKMDFFHQPSFDFVDTNDAHLPFSARSQEMKEADIFSFIGIFFFFSFYWRNNCRFTSIWTTYVYIFSARILTVCFTDSVYNTNNNNSLLLKLKCLNWQEIVYRKTYKIC